MCAGRQCVIWLKESGRADPLKESDKADPLKESDGAEPLKDSGRAVSRNLDCVSQCRMCAPMRVRLCTSNIQTSPSANVHECMDQEH